jgi:hypothetical protein
MVCVVAWAGDEAIHKIASIARLLDAARHSQPDGF